MIQMIDPALSIYDDTDISSAAEGLSLEQLVNAPRLTSMLSRLPIDLVSMSSCVEAADISDAVRGCRTCRSAGACDAWVTAHEEGAVNTAPPFCPVSTLFDAYVRDALDD